jgi:hypothetical protein
MLPYGAFKFGVPVTHDWTRHNQCAGRKYAGEPLLLTFRVTRVGDLRLVNDEIGEGFERDVARLLQNGKGH